MIVYALGFTFVETAISVACVPCDNGTNSRDSPYFDIEGKTLHDLTPLCFSTIYLTALILGFFSLLQLPLSSPPPPLASYQPKTGRYSCQSCPSMTDSVHPLSQVKNVAGMEDVDVLLRGNRRDMYLLSRANINHVYVFIHFCD